MLRHFIERLFDCYWYVYKSQVPEPYGCMDNGKEFFRSLSVFGKLLYLIRPLMIRPKQRKNKSSIFTPKIKIPKDDSYINNRLYYSLIANSLQSIFIRDSIHISWSNANSTSLTSETGGASAMSATSATSATLGISEMIPHTYHEGSVIITYSDDTSAVDEWSMGEKVSYMMIIDLCQFVDFNLLHLSDEIRRALTISNAGGSSEISESLSMYYMLLKFGARHFIPEMEVNYRFQSNICDYLMEINGQRVGVSVTRAINYPFDKAISKETANTLLYKKLTGIVIAKRAVTSRHNFDISVIHIWCRTLTDAQTLRDAYKVIIDNDIYGLYGNICITCSVCLSEFIYTNIGCS